MAARFPERPTDLDLARREAQLDLRSVDANDVLQSPYAISVLSVQAPRELLAKSPVGLLLANNCAWCCRLNPEAERDLSDGLRVKFLRVGPTGTVETVYGYGTLTGYTESNEVASIVSWEMSITGYGPYQLELDSN